MLMLLTGCPKAVVQDVAAPAPALTAEQERADGLAALESEALALVKKQHELLWAHWTRGAPLDLEKPALEHAVLFENATLAKVRAAKLHRLEAWLVGERLARATAAANATVTGLEGAATFNLDGRVLQWKDLSRLLAHEKSAVKRKALWAASREAIPQLAEEYRKRDEAVTQALAALGSTAEAFSAVTSEESAALGQKLLDDTEAEWKKLLDGLAKAELGLPADKVTRADLPRMLRPGAAADASFPKEEQAAKATAVLAALGLYGLPGLTLDLSDSAKKNPLPLTVVPGGAADVRVSFKPVGGARDVSALLGELGRALALRELGEPRLQGSLQGDTAHRLFSDLGATAGWLKAQGVADAAIASAVDSARSLQLYTARRAAANLVAQHKARGQSDEAAGKLWAEGSARALGIAVPPEDAARWRLERDPLFRGVEVIRALQQAEQLRQRLGAQWWAEPASAAILKAAWSGKEAAAAPCAADGGSAPCAR